MLHTVLDGEAVDHLEDNLAFRNFIREHIGKDSLCCRSDGGADAVATANADDDLILLGIVYRISCGIDTIYSLQLLSEELLKMLGCSLNLCFVFHN